MIIPLNPSYRDLSKSELSKLLGTEVHLCAGKGIGGNLKKSGQLVLLNFYFTHFQYE